MPRSSTRNCQVCVWEGRERERERSLEREREFLMAYFMRGNRSHVVSLPPVLPSLLRDSPVHSHAAPLYTPLPASRSLNTVSAPCTLAFGIAQKAKRLHFLFRKLRVTINGMWATHLLLNIFEKRNVSNSATAAERLALAFFVIINQVLTLCP